DFGIRSLLEFPVVDLERFTTRFLKRLPELSNSGSLPGIAGRFPVHLTDCTLAMLARQRVLVLTDDLPLYAQLVSEGSPVLNFTHLRSAAYGWLPPE
ncbi:MAG TPA: hypothetical protein VI136_11010, partial [Verrucomicrobiae bacterium]